MSFRKLISSCHFYMEDMTVNDVKDWFKLVMKEFCVMVDPGTDFKDYITPDKTPVFSVKEAALLNRVMNKAIKVCKADNVDIFQIAVNVDAMFYPTQLVLLRSAKCFIDTNTGNTFKIVGGKIDLEEPVHLDDIEISDWFDSLDVNDTLIVQNTISNYGSTR